LKRFYRNIVTNKDFKELSIFLFFVIVAFGFWYMQKVSDKDDNAAEQKSIVNEEDVVMSDMSLDVPIHGINMPAKTQLKTFPSKTRVSFLVDLKKIHDVKVTDFDVVVDYSTLPNDATQAELRLGKSPSIVRHVELMPTSVEFLIEKR